MIKSLFTSWVRRLCIQYIQFTFSQIWIILKIIWSRKTMCSVLSKNWWTDHSTLGSDDCSLMNVCQHWEQFSSFQDCGRRERCSRFLAMAGSTLQGRGIPMWSYPHCRPLAGLSRALLLPVSNSLWDHLSYMWTGILQATQLYLVIYLINKYYKDHCGKLGVPHKVTIVMGS